MGGVRDLISVVDDDVSVRESLPPLLKSLGFPAEAFESAEAFLQSTSMQKTACIVLDITMPGMSGPDLFRELVRRGLRIPVVFITAIHDDVLRTELLREGAVDCLYKPFSENDLEEAVTTALEKGARS
ncbi:MULTISPECIES: response regulator transcription factor [Rhizobium]|uniref:response regulator transcription factor n=1 Tax=Rhizobium TaxID=379 RepID=UPI0012606A10|nr:MULTISPECIES: response regulator [Rhizobium]GLU85023.1 response regulator [Rhizobium sp. NBRC 114257]